MSFPKGVSKGQGYSWPQPQKKSQILFYRCVVALFAKICGQWIAKKCDDEIWWCAIKNSLIIIITTYYIFASYYYYIMWCMKRKFNIIIIIYILWRILFSTSKNFLSSRYKIYTCRLLFFYQSFVVSDTIILTKNNIK